MIADRVAELLTTAPMASAGTRDAQNRPSFHIVAGVVLHDDRLHVTALVPEHCSARLRENVADNGRLALAINAFDGESYQLKGQVTEVRESTEAERAVQDAALRNITEHARPFLGDPLMDAAARGTFYPSLAVTFRVEQVFVQTPGPGAGRAMGEGG